MNERDKYFGQIRIKLTPRDLLENLAEEASEVAQAALKMIRAYGWSKNTTPVTTAEAQVNLEEEIIDLLCMLDVIGYDLQHLLDAEKACRKWRRWANRLEEGEKHD